MMRFPTILSLAAGLLAMHASTASAQYGLPGYGYMPYASTAGEGFAIGMADMVRSAGMATLMTSKAAVNVEDARSANIDNQLKHTQVWLERQRLLGSYHASLRKPPPTSEQLYRYAQARRPKPLSASEFDPLTGAITWPVVLRAEPFKSYRGSAEKFFREVAEKPETFSFELYSSFEQASAECLAALKKHIKSYRPDDFIRAKKFVESLNYSAQHL